MARSTRVKAGTVVVRNMLVGALLSVAAPAGSVLAQECAVENGVYKMGAADDAMLVMKPLSEPTLHSDLGIEIEIEGHDGPFAFSLTASNGYSNVYAIADDETLSDAGLMVFFFQRQGDRLVAYEGEIPSSGMAAPEAIFLPELGSTLWYATNGSDDPVLIETGIWYLDDCTRP